MGLWNWPASCQSGIRMIVRLHLLLGPLLLLLLARTALAGQCMVSGDCVITGTVNGEWNDDWGCDNVNACWDEAGTDPTNPTATTRDPNNNCPGGNLEACISLCPEEDADIYQACVHDCMENC